MSHGRKKPSGSHAVPNKAAPLGLVVLLAAAGGAVIGSAVTYIAFKPLAASKQAAAPTAGGTPPTFALPTMQRQQQFVPAPQPPGEVPPGKVWSVEHGHWHDNPGDLRALVPTLPTVTPAATRTPAPAATPAAK